MKQVQGIAADLMATKDRKAFEKQCGRLPGSKVCTCTSLEKLNVYVDCSIIVVLLYQPLKNVKIPYPQLMHIRKLERERQRKAQELVSL
jgi:hypothetical protein